MKLYKLFGCLHGFLESFEQFPASRCVGGLSASASLHLFAGSADYLAGIFAGVNAVLAQADHQCRLSAGLVSQYQRHIGMFLTEGEDRVFQLVQLGVNQLYKNPLRS